MTIYVGAHRGLTARQRQQISLKEGFLAPVAASGAPLFLCASCLAGAARAAGAAQRQRGCVGVAKAVGVGLGSGLSA